MNANVDLPAGSENKTKGRDKTPGGMLRQAREAQALPVEEVCRELGITGCALRALENNQLDKLPPLVYVKGYIRRYCDILDLKPIPILSALEDLTLGINRVEPENHIAPPSRKPWLLWMGSVATFLLISTAVLWAVYSEGKEVEQLNIDKRQSRAAERQRVMDESVAAGKTVIFHFQQDSWLEVIDANDHILAVELHRAGSNFQVEGQPPFHISMGNGPGVAVIYRDEAVSFASNPQTRHAEFVLGR